MSNSSNDWKCATCSFAVFGSKSSCPKCGFARGSAPQQQQQLAHVSVGRRPDWLCPNCNVSVFGSKPACFKCGAPNPAIAGAPAAGEASPAAAAVAPHAGPRPDWACPQCNLKVFGSKPACFKCGTPNPAGAAPATVAAAPAAAGMGRRPDWLCPKCNVSVFGSKPACFKCGTDNPAIAAALSPPQAAGAGPRRPDWPCPKCNITVFGSKPACFKCGTPNPAIATATTTGSAFAAPLSAAALAKREAELRQREKDLEQRLVGAAVADIVSAVPPPSAWTAAAATAAPEPAADPSGVIKVEITDKDELACFAALCLASCAGSNLPGGLGIRRVWRIKNVNLWVQYGTLRQLYCIGQPPKLPLPHTPRTSKHLERCVASPHSESVGLTTEALQPLANEAFLFHGTKPDIANIIASQGFDERVASLSGLFGGGVYFADDFTKSHAYTSRDPTTHTRWMFVSRVLLGSMTPVQKSKDMPRGARRAPDGFDTVCGYSNAHEFIVYDRRQTYPEFLIEYAEAPPNAAASCSSM